MAPTREPPAPGDPVLVARPFDGRRAILDGRAAAADRPVLDQHRMGHVRGQVDAHHAVHLGPDHDAPPGRAIGRSEGFDHLQIGAAVDLEPAQGRRDHEVEQLRVEERLDDRRR